jgi:RNA polymerase sigma-70 factor (ECF subfamily)
MESFYEDLFDEMYNLLLNYAIYKIRDASAAQDVVQDVCLIAWEELDRVMASPNPRGWLMNALKNRIHKYGAALADAQQRTEPLTDSILGQGPSFDPTDSEVSFVSVLNPQEMRIATLKEQGYIHREIANILNLRPGTIDSAVLRIKEKINRSLEDNGP